jgi:hypothetical protein
MTAPQAAKFFRQWVRLIEKYSRARAIMQAGIKRDIISAPSLRWLARFPATHAQYVCLPRA